MKPRRCIILSDKPMITDSLLHYSLLKISSSNNLDNNINNNEYEKRLLDCDVEQYVIYNDLKAQAKQQPYSVYILQYKLKSLNGRSPTIDYCSCIQSLIMLLAELIASRNELYPHGMNEILRHLSLVMMADKIKHYSQMVVSTLY